MILNHDRHFLRSPNINIRQCAIKSENHFLTIYETAVNFS